MTRGLVIGLIVLLLAGIAAGLLWWNARQGTRAAEPELDLRVRLSAPAGQPMARETPIFLSASLRARSRPAVGRSGVGDENDTAPDKGQIRLGSERRPWWQDLQLEQRVGDAKQDVAFRVVPGVPQPYVEVGTADIGHVQLLLPPDHDLPAGPVTLEASWQAGDLSARSRPLTLDVGAAAQAQTTAVFNARYFLEVDEVQRATAILEEALVAYPDNAALHSLRGQAFEESGEIQAAAAAYSRALDLAMERLPADAQEPPMIFIRQLQRVQAKMAGSRASR